MSLVLAATLFLPTTALADDGEAVADPDTRATWQTTVGGTTTENVGRIWTDKSVNTGDVTLTGGSSESITVAKDPDADFLVSLSALSSASSLSSSVTTPLDIVLVLDVSGSMGYGMDGSQRPGYTYTEAYPAATSGTYYIQNGSGWQRVTYNARNGSWGYRSGWQWVSVAPKTSAEDADAGHVQFYTQETDSRLTALKHAVNNFIDVTAAQNAGLADDKQNRISLVTYASSAAVHSDFTFEFDGLKSTVGNLTAAGSTDAGEGMEYAQAVIDGDRIGGTWGTTYEGARDDAKTVVIFFTDGVPTTGNTFSTSVANTAVSAAHDLKAGGTTIYSIGIFDGADPSETQGGTDQTERANQFMNAVSSNYPNATAYDQLGTRAEGNPDYYKVATDADELNGVFEGLADEINASSGAPTKVTVSEGLTDANNSGYITFTDVLGDYMEVKSFEEIVYANTRVEPEDSDPEVVGGVKTYRFSGSFGGSAIYPDADFENVEVTVTPGEGSAGDTVTVRIPAANIPVRYFDIDADEGTGSITEAYPLRVFYSVGLKDSVDLANPDAALESYVAAHNDGAGSAYFYSNAFSGTGASATALTTASFEPAEGNQFYHFGATPLYTAGSEDSPAVAGSFDTGRTYYYQKTTWTVSNGVATPATEWVAISGLASDQVTRVNGQWQIKAGTPKPLDPSAYTLGKSQNSTQTAENSFVPSFEGGVVSVALGNNGRLAVEQPGSLEVTKTLAAAEGFELPDAAHDGGGGTSFGFTLGLEGIEEGATFDAQVYGSDGSPHGSAWELGDGGTFTLKNGETLKVEGLPAGATYTVSEDEAAMPAGYTQTGATGDTGAIVAGQTAQASFVNTYRADSVELDGATYLQVAKNFTGRDWRDTDEFSFEISAVGGTDVHGASIAAADMPLPAQTQVTIGADAAGHQASFGNMEFEAPGTYTYTIAEVVGGIDQILGVNYSSARYRVVVTVTDAGDGTMEVASAMTQVVNDAGVQGETPVADNVATFANTYSATGDAVSLLFTKEYANNSGDVGKNLASGMFSVQLEAVGGFETEGGSLDAPDVVEAADVPMPAGAQDGRITVANSDNRFVFGDIAYTGNDAGYTYVYRVTEVATPAVNGMTYDKSTKTVSVVVSETEDDGGVVINAVPTYSDDDQTAGNEQVFRNEYNVAPATASVEGSKVLTGRDMQADDEFSFVLEPSPETQAAIQAGAVELPANMAEVSGTAASGTAAPFSFDGITFKRAGTFTFQMRETLPAGATEGNGYTFEGIAYDTHVCTVAVTVANNDGTLEATVNYGSGANANRFENVYRASTVYGAHGALDVQKTLEGRAMAQGEFEFAIAAAEGTPEKLAVPAGDASFVNPQGSADGQPVVMNKLGSLAFDQTDAGKTYTYTVTEVRGNAGGVAYDDTVYTVDITVVDNGDGTMHTLTKVTDDQGEATEFPAGETPVVAFENVYRADPTALVEVGGAKLFTGRDVQDADRFSFLLTPDDATAASDGSIMVGDQTFAQAHGASASAEVAGATGLVAGEAEQFSFAGMTFTKAGTYTFTMKEVLPGAATEENGYTVAGVAYDTHEAKVTVTVTDPGTGQLVANVGVDDGLFENAYAPAPAETSIEVEKSFTGREGGAWLDSDSFAFSVEPYGEETQAAADAGEVHLSAGGSAEATIGKDTAGHKASLGGIVFEKAGTYTFLVREVLPDEATEENGYTVRGTAYDADGRIVTVQVEDNLDGTMTATVDTAGVMLEDGVTASSLVFANVYTADRTDGTVAGFQLAKVFEGHAWTDGYEFAFKLTPGSEDTPMPQDAEGNVVDVVAVSAPTEADGKTAQFDFGSIAYNKAGTYTYTVTEVVDDATANPGIAYDEDNVATVTVTVTDRDQEGNPTGQLVATAVVENGTFTNVYGTGSADYDAQVGLQIAKNMTGRAQAAGDFTFTLTPVSDDAKALFGSDPVTYQNVAATLGATEDAANVSMGTVAVPLNHVFTLDDDGKSYEFTVAETGYVGTEAEGYANDDHVYRVVIEAADDGRGVLTVTTKVDGEVRSSVTAGRTTTATESPVTLTFDNAYDAGEVTVGGNADARIAATKSLENRPLENGQFTFEVRNKLDAAGGVVATGTNDAAGAVAFGELTYTTASLNRDVAAKIATVDTSGAADVYTYQYTVSEATDGLADDGITAKTQSFDIVVEVTDDRAGNLTARVVYPADSGGVLAFENVYGTDDVFSLEIAGSKALAVASGDNPPTLDGIAGAYTFTLNGSDGAPMPEDGITQVTNDAAGNVKFGGIAFTMEGVFGDTGTVAGAAEGDGGDADAAGGDGAGDGEADVQRLGQRTKEFTYTITESGAFDGVDNDPVATKTVVVTVVDNGDGTISVTKAPDASATGGNDFTFTNVYGVDPVDSSPTGAGNLSVTKVLDAGGLDHPLEEGAFAFALEAADGTTYTAVNDAAGAVDFEPITFTAPGVYAYTLGEVVPEGAVQGELAGVKYDTATYAVTATVTDGGSGTLSVAWEVAGANGNAVTFENSYAANPASLRLMASKSLTGRSLEEGEFAFELREVTEGVDDPVVLSAANDAKGGVLFDAIRYTEPGEHDYEMVEIAGDAEGVTYDDAVYSIHVSVRDNGAGQLVAEWSYADGASPVFVNAYAAPQVPAAGDSEPTLPETGDANGGPMLAVALAAALAALVAGVAALKLRAARAARPAARAARRR